jgi:hypothetical protein
MPVLDVLCIKMLLDLICYFKTVLRRIITLDKLTFSECVESVRHSLQHRVIQSYILMDCLDYCYSGKLL